MTVTTGATSGQQPAVTRGVVTWLFTSRLVDASQDGWFHVYTAALGSVVSLVWPSFGA
jgi:hypothetical protein